MFKIFKYVLISCLLCFNGVAYAGHYEQINNSQLPIISANKIPAPTVSTLGGVKAFTAVTSEFITSIDINGNITAVQPNFSDLLGAVSIGQGGTGQTTAAASLNALGGVNKAGDTMTGALNTNSNMNTKTTLTCATTDGGYTGDGTATYVPTCLGHFAGASPNAFTIYATRGTTSSNGVYPPASGAGTPTSNATTGSLFQYQANGANAYQVDGLAVNFDVVGGSVSQAHPSDSQSPNAVALFIGGHQRPDSSGNRPPTMWGINTDLVISPSSGNVQTYGYESDLSNFNTDCGVGYGCTSAWYFYGGINAYPNLAFHYIANQLTSSWSGTVATSGNAFTLSSMDASAATTQFVSRITYINYNSKKYRVTCSTTTTCTADVTIGTNSTAAAFTAKSSAAHFGLFFQDGTGGSEVQDSDVGAYDAAYSIIKGAGNHAVGFDFTQDAMPNAAFLAAGQNICYNGTSACVSYSTASTAWLFQTGLAQSSSVASIDTSGNASFGNITSAGLANLSEGLVNTTHNGDNTGSSLAPNDPSASTATIQHFYSGQNVLASFIQDDVAASATAAEQTGVFRMVSHVGGAGNISQYKMALGAEGIGYAGSSPVFGATIVGTYLNGYDGQHNTMATIELDMNQLSGYNCTGADEGVVGTVGCSVLGITGASANNIRAGISISGYNHILDGIQFNTGGVISYDIRSYDQATNFIADNGQHAGNGLYAASATYGGNFIVGPGNNFIVDANGLVTAAGLTLNGSPTPGNSNVAIGSPTSRFNAVYAQALSAPIFYPSAGYTKANLPAGQPNGATTYCTDCRKTGEAAGAGTGAMVFFSNGAWQAVASAVAAN